MAGILSLAISTSASAKALNFDSAPVADAVAQIDRAFDAQITIQPGVDADSLVSFTVVNASEPGARLEAINDLANALNADYAKVFIVRHATGDVLIPDPPVDSVEAPVFISGGTVDASEAIRTIASVDDATVKFYSPVDGSVTLSNQQMTAADAAGEVARQTHTIWKAEYVISPRTARRTASTAVEGKIIGYTTGGQPITELPGETFRAATEPKVEDEKPSQPKADDKTDKSDTSADQSNTPQSNPNPYGYGYPYGSYPGYGYGYGGSPYGGTTVIGPGSAVTSYGQGFNPYSGYNSPYGGGYGYSPYGGYAPNGALGGNGTTVLGPSSIGMMQGMSGYGGIW